MKDIEAHRCGSEATLDGRWKVFATSDDSMGVSSFIATGLSMIFRDRKRHPQLKDHSTRFVCEISAIAEDAK